MVSNNVIIWQEKESELINEVSPKGTSCLLCEINNDISAGMSNNHLQLNKSNIV